ncbi:glycoside hydrolase family 78 protein [Aestuariibaculum suncheonense]|uniref:Fibronectin type III domain-containing protein n=1 Tax=Aestuariibaculum suncheonense TaxID=1028745 RepID=A0A8J6QIN3_9FLAO|nr:fibronectin type III domain-containing protein [Aestuariibaculum suncheonense]MBD0836990.1 fibronectin type III domain-containing protein [Aestuariibaculum suncheonense]
MISLFSCSSDKPSNSLPSIPGLVSPANNLLCLENVIEFQWNASIDNDRDEISYLLEVSTDNKFSKLDYSKRISFNKHTFSLEPNTTYYWRVKAIDSENNESEYSAVFSFYTEGFGVRNHLPYIPELVSPGDYSKLDNSEVNLKWGGRDPDSDMLTYDIYFDSYFPPSTLISENQTGPTLIVQVESGKNYYWQVVSKDGKGGVTSGLIWTFSIY